MVNKEFIKKWVATLRSGDYKQGKRYLRFNDKFCCLGVACDIIDKTKWYAYGNIYNYGIFTSVLDDDTVKYIGLDDQNYLIAMNDSGKTFDEIADYIEEKYLNVKSI